MVYDLLFLRNQPYWIGLCDSEDGETGVTLAIRFNTPNYRINFNAHTHFSKRMVLTCYSFIKLLNSVTKTIDMHTIIIRNVCKSIKIEYLAFSNIIIQSLFSNSRWDAHYARRSIRKHYIMRFHASHVSRTQKNPHAAAKK